MTPRSMAAVENIRKICEEHLKDRCELEVIDIYQQPTLAKGEHDFVGRVGSGSPDTEPCSRARWRTPIAR